MNYTYKVFLIILVFFIFSCSKEEKKISVITESDIETQMIEFYREGVEALEDGDGFYAAKKFNEAALIFPQSEWAPKSLLMKY